MAARYAFPDAWFPVNNNPRLKARASYGDAQCVYVRASNSWLLHFEKVYGVRTEQTYDADVSSGGGGGTRMCRRETIVMEIDYGDGTGWHEIWRGEVTVCS